MSSMSVNFYKYQGAGNDFIITNDFKGNSGSDMDYIAASSGIIKNMCERKFGIGSDGFVIIRRHPEYDFEMKFFNSNFGQPSTLCGNGSRCTVRCAYDWGIVKKKEITFLAYDGVHRGVVHDDDNTSMTFRDIEEVTCYSHDEYYVHSGSPHHILLLDTLDFDIMTLGPKLDSPAYRNHPQNEGTNVMFALKEKDENGEYKVRSYETGVRDETLACGSGSIAIAAALAVRDKLPFGNYEYCFRFQGGLLMVRFDFCPPETFTNIWLTGATKKVFEGTYLVPRNQ